MAYLLDSGFLYAALDNQDKHHQSVSAILNALNDDIIFPFPAITETAYFVLKNMGVEALSVFLESLSQTDFILEAPTSADFARSAAIIRQYDDANIDFVDAIIVAMAERLEITRILTIDQRHFRMFRPIHCDAFEILP